MSTKRIEYLKVGDLVFDPENPRLPQTLRSKKNTPEYETEVIDWMLQFENVTELMGSIGEKGFFPAEPILVVKNTSDKYEVVEGNRRLTAIKLLNNPELATRKKRTLEEILSEANKSLIPTTVPAIVFEQRDEVLAYLGYKHITGVQPWDSLAKAKYLKQLLATLTQGTLYEKYRTLAKIIGSKTNYVRLLLVGVDTYFKIEEENFFDIPSLGEESFEFGVFYTALQKPNIAQYLGIDFEAEEPTSNLNDQHLKDITSWIFEKNADGFTRVGESRNLKDLNKILDNRFPKALESFKQGRTLNESVRLTDHPVEVFQNNLNNALAALEVARNYSHEVTVGSDSQLTILKEINAISADLHRLMKSKMTELDELE